MRRVLAVVPLIACLAGCQTAASIVAPTPSLTPVGEGLAVARTSLAVAPSPVAARAPSSLWSQADHGLFKDLTARQVGDVITVSIDINDQAQFDNSSGRSKTGSAKAGFSLGLGFGGFGLDNQSGSADGSLDASGTASAKGAGTIDRSEKLHLTIAAVVSDVLPGGNLLIGGSQEIQVNNEIRVLTVAGIVRPFDIQPGNMIAYDKIAEARVSYGGRGKLTAVQ